MSDLWDDERGGPCRVCGNPEGLRHHTAREMMFGTRELFPYLECRSCGCIQIARIPDDLDRHYPVDYYSFSAPDGPRPGSLTRTLLHHRNRHEVLATGLLGRVVARIRPAPLLRSLRPAGVGPESRILDVGSGSGRLVRELRQAGFSRALGIDPYLEAAPEEDGDGPVLRRSLAEMEPEWDLIMFHHAFEHVPDPLETLRHCTRLLGPKGTCLIRMPNARSEAWRRYGVDWVQLDPPRHLHVHTPESLRRLAARAGLELQRVVHDSTEFQFWGSEQYRRDVPLLDPASHAVDPSLSMFSRNQIRRFKKEARALNARGEGDQAAFYLGRARAAGWAGKALHRLTRTLTPPEPPPPPPGTAAP